MVSAEGQPSPGFNRGIQARPSALISAHQDAIELNFSVPVELLRAARAEDIGIPAALEVAPREELCIRKRENTRRRVVSVPFKTTHVDAR